MNETDAVRIAETIRFAIAAERISHNGHEIAVTLSAGIATSPGHSMTVTQLIAATDAALYAAKEIGRNCVMRASQLTARTE